MLVLMRRGALCVVAISLALAFGPGASALAAETHVFDPALSLTGGCGASEADPVLDPSCPDGYPLGHKSFSQPKSITTDSYGDIFVASFGQNENGSEGRIDIFDPKGFYVTEVVDSYGPRNLAVDVNGNLYVYDKHLGASGRLVRFVPKAYHPEGGEIKYEEEPVMFAGNENAVVLALAVNPLNQHLFAHQGQFVTEFGSASEGNKVITEKVVQTPSATGSGLAIDAFRKRIYASDLKHSGKFPDPSVIRIVELEPPYAEIGMIDGSTTPAGKFTGGEMSVGVDESTGHVFVYDVHGAEVVYEFTEDGEYLGTLGSNLSGHPVPGAQIVVDNGKNSPNGAMNPFGRYLFAPAYPSATGHVFAYGPLAECLPKIEGVAFEGVTESEANLEADIEPCGLETHYVFEYTTKGSFEEEGFAGAQTAGEGQIPAGFSPVPVSAALEGLTPGATFRFRVIAENTKGADEGEAQFATYPESAVPPCLNEPLRIGASALLPDCRAYELVTPPDTNARAPQGLGQLAVTFPTRNASPTGDAVTFEIEGGTIPGYEGTGSYAGDPYLAGRGEDGWKTSYVGPSGAESSKILPGGNSPDQGYSFFNVGSKSNLAIEENETSYMRYPDGHFALVGRGSIGVDPRATGRLISEGGGHVIFVTGTVTNPPIQLEPNAPPSGTVAVYDRRIDPGTGEEETHVVSLLPGDVTPAAGEDSFFEGTSLDGRGVAFKLGGTLPDPPLYLRYNDEETYEVAKEGTTAGVAEGGKRVFYLEGGDLYAFDVESEEAIRFTESSDVTVVNVAADGTAAYFVSPSAIPTEPNPNGASPQAGKENLYLSREGLISFVGTLTKPDVEEKLDTWVPHVASYGEVAEDPSRSTPDGSVLLFESRAPLTGYDPEGHTEVYRYDSTSGELGCLSCNPTLAPAGGEASLESFSEARSEPEPFGAFALVDNLRSDGRRAFFQSTEPLVLGDTDGLQDVYEWEAQGVGSCERPEGCVYLVSSGTSAHIDYIYSVSDSGDDIFFRSSDLLLPSDSDETPSIYDARVEGGFPEPSCEGSGCFEKQPVFPPALTVPASPASGKSGNVTPKKHCPRGKRKVSQSGKVKCVKKHHKRRHHIAGSKKQGAGK
jgi:hypothetical protein